MDRYISILNFYIMNAEKLIVNLKTSAKPLQNLNYYNYIIRRVLINEATKKFNI
jgi:hypothetical protein